MDPLSAVASVVAVATLAAQVTTAFAELRKDSAELPGRLHALSNEVADIKFVLSQVAAVVQERQRLSELDQNSIPALLQQAETKLKYLTNILDRLAGSCKKESCRGRGCGEGSFQSYKAYKPISERSSAVLMSLGASSSYASLLKTRKS